MVLMKRESGLPPLAACSLASSLETSLTPPVRIISEKTRSTSPGANDDLEHAARDEGALEVGILVESLLVDLVHVIEDKTQTRCTVRCCVDVVGATDVCQDVLRHAGMIHCHPGVSFLVMGPQHLGGRGNPTVGIIADSLQPHLCQSIVTLQ